MQGRSSKPNHHNIFASLDELEEVAALLLKRVLPRAGDWALRTIEALPGEERESFGWRDYLHLRSWKHPRSNAAERIEVYLWLAKRLDDTRFREAALHAGHALLDDPVRGIYRGSEEDGQGMVWYWRDVGLYMTNYTMRVPPAFLRLARATGDKRFRDAALLCGEQLLHSQAPTGILRAGWYPKEPQDAATPLISPHALDHWLPKDRINIRFAHVARAYAELFQSTGDSRYANALDRLSHALETLIHPDGSLPSDVRVSILEPADSALKGHFLYYVLNGLVGAKRCFPSGSPFDAVLDRLSSFILGRADHQWSAPFGDLTSTSSPLANRQRGSADPAYGFAYRAHIGGDTRYRIAALQLVVAALLRCCDAPEAPDRHGGLVVSSGDSPPEFYIDGHTHFWLLMGIRALEATAAPGSPLCRKASLDSLPGE